MTTSQTTSGPGIKPEWVSLLETATLEVFQMMLGTELDKARPAPLQGTEFTAMVGLAGQICGVMSVRCSQESASLAAALMLGLPPDEAAANAWDAIGEVANMIAGNFKNKIDGVSDKCMLSVPTVITGSDYSFRSLADTTPLEMWFSFKGKPLGITLEIHS